VTATLPAALPMSLVGTDPAATASRCAKYPGGPDSLRAVVRRALRGASPTLTGQVFLYVRFEKGMRWRKPAFLEPPAGTPAAALVENEEVKKLARGLLQQLTSFEPGQPEPGRVDRPAEGIILPLTFGPDAAQVPLSDSDEHPNFPTQTLLDASGQRRPAPNLAAFVNGQIRYPALELQLRNKGRVYGYFEGSETGSIEHQRVIGGVSPGLDAEVLRVLQTIPPALTPPRYRGQPVRVFYVQPITFKIQ